MKFLSLFRPETGEEGQPPSPEHMAQMGALIEEWMAKGALITTEPLAPRDQCARIEFRDGQFKVSDVSERMGGYALLQAGSKDEAVELCKVFLKVTGGGTCELREVPDFSPPAE